jgi:hydroxypyruvate isomerase
MIFIFGAPVANGDLLSLVRPRYNGITAVAFRIAGFPRRSDPTTGELPVND